MTRIALTTAVALVALTVFAGSGLVDAAERKADAGAAELISVMATPSSGKADALYTVPSRSRLLVTRACIEHSAMTVAIGMRSDNSPLSFGRRGCTEYQPGFIVAAGETIYCDNRSGLERTCVLVGVVEDLPAFEKPRVRFYDLK